MDRGSWQATVHRAHRVGHNWRTGPKLTLKWTSSILLMEWSRILEGLMLELKLQCFGYLMRRADTLKRPWFGKRLRAREGGNRGWDGWMASLTQWIWVWVNSGSWWWTGKPGVLQVMGSPRVGHDWVTELNWSDGTGCHDLSFFHIEFQANFFTLHFHRHQDTF